MKTRVTILMFFMVFAVGFVNLSGFAQDSEPGDGGTYGSPKRFEPAIRSFEAADEKQPPPENAIVVVGSSSIRGWHGSIKQDMSPMTVIPRGFGGSNMNDLLYYADRIVLPYRPQAVVVYEGDNDVAQGISPAKIADAFRVFVGKVHKVLPECRIYFLSIKPSISRWPLWSKMKAANDLIAAECARDKRLTFVDVASGMLDEEGKPRGDIFEEDNLHMNRRGYELWRGILRPVLIKAEKLEF
ncbi:MAG: hypothetical protein KJO08_05065 [Gammaproteobacteria bacterium]|nr:hypothetical protein [Gammaproteobacteria bacterium]NNJ85202.1 hypothetical protein [Gammaproteobacteria bacterium]